MRSDLAQVLHDYEAAWNEPDGCARARMLDACVADAVVMTPGYKPDAPVIRGRDALSAEMGTMIGGRPSGRGFRLTLAGAVDAHHGWGRIAWRVVDPDGVALRVGGAAIAGLDVVHLAHDGRLEQIVVFVGD